MPIRSRSWFVLSLASVASCAGLDYVKVPTPTQYSTWTDEDQRNADKMEGVRYYLPRPFVHLKQSVPVAQRTAFVSFVYDSRTKRYRATLPTAAPTWLVRAVPQSLSPAQALRLLSVASGAPKDSLANEQDGTPREKPPSEPAQPMDDQPDPKADDKPPTTLKATTGFINDTDPVTELSDLMDVVYLPDFEEQYVIHARTSLGQASIETKLRNGWAAEVFSNTVDNSNLIPYVFNQVEKASELAAKIVTTWASQGASDLGAVALESLAHQQSAGGDEGSLQLLGDVLLFKVAEVKLAQPGLYPILKPREIEHWLGKAAAPLTNGDPEANFETFLSSQRLPWIRPDMAFIPCPPFTVIGFNVTTDIYFAPASRPIDLTTRTKVTKPTDHAAPSSGVLKLFEALLRARAGGAHAEIRSLTGSDIEAQADATKTATVIRLKGKAGAFKADNKNDYGTWASTALKLSANTQVQTAIDPQGDGVTITLQASLEDIAKNL